MRQVPTVKQDYLYFEELKLVGGIVMYMVI